jgi:catechol 2,3-dioxygenase-like lactoylglutathione lyase family enzyme
VLGKFLELSIATPDVRASLDFYRRLGFSEAGVGEAWEHPYAVVTDGRLCLGLHQNPGFEPSLTFVKPELLKHVEALEIMGVEPGFRRLAGDVFNQIGWSDPSGHVIRLVEARTFSPVKRRPTEESLCGYFLEIGLPAPSRESAKIHWEQFGFVGMDEPDAALPHVTCTSDTIDVGFYDPIHLREPTLVFEVDDFDAAMGRLAAAGVTPAGRVPSPLKHARAAMLVAPEGTSLLLIGKPEEPPAA